MQFLIRSARPDESAALTGLARAAKASHGYPPEWLRQWEPELQLTPDYLGTHRVFVAERRHDVTGVVALEERPVGWSLEHLWVDPAMQNQGVGRALVLHALATARALKPGPVTLTADPGAAAFYERLGARRVGEQPAPMPGEPGRVLPLFEFPTPGGRIAQDRIYTDHAREYDALVSAEDCDGHLLPALERLVPLSGSAVLEVGIGTGRLTRMLLPRVARLVGVEPAPAMLAEARRHVAALPPDVAGRADLHEADARALPVPDAWADLAIAGWVFGHLRHWLPDDWRGQVATALNEMERALKPGGVLVVIETLGTGCAEPAPPNPALGEFYAWLETERGMTRAHIRTDYQFADVSMAAVVTGFFFGPEFAERVRRENWARVPECTGLWSKRVGAVGGPRPGGAR